MDITNVINQMVVLIAFIGIGFLIRKLGITDDVSNKYTSKLVINVLQPGLILSSMANVESDFGGMEILYIVGVSLAMYAVTGVLALLVPKILRADKEDSGLFSVMTMFGNVAFMGFPVIAAIFGQGAVFYASLFNLPFNLLLFTIGVRMLNRDKKATANLKDIFGPPFIASIIAIILFVLKIPVWAPLNTVMSMMGTASIVLSMVIIGTSLGGVSLKSLFGDVRIYAFLPMRLIVCPVLVWAVLRLFVTDTLILGIAVSLSAMPVAAITTMLCIEYGGKGGETLASKGVFLSTILSAVTIPLVAYLLI